MPSNLTGWVIAGIGFTVGTAVAKLIIGVVTSKLSPAG
jgi:branched-subunit amino acid ABC-type transport system permease component